MLDIDARSGAFEILQQVERGGYADRLLDRWLHRNPNLESRERGLLTELVYGVPRLRGRLDFALERFCRQPLEKLEPAARLLLRLGAYQLLELDRVPDRAAVHATVELARRSGLERLTGLLNGVLRALTQGRAQIEWPDREKPRPYMEHVCSLPAWIAREMMRLLPNAEAIALAEAMAKQPPLAMRVNTLKKTRDEYLAALQKDGHLARPCNYSPEGVVVIRRGQSELPGDAAGWYQVQDEASMLISHLLQAQPGERVLDACAAPGGKTTHLAALGQNRVEIIALDLHPQRVGLVRRGARRLGCENIDARQWDMTEPPDFLEPESFDRILVDAPCSGLGVLRRNPESRWRMKSNDVTRLAELQATILDRVAGLLRPGGVLVYSVCTFTERETDRVVTSFLESRQEFAPEGFAPELPAAWRPLFTDKGYLRTWPHRHDGMDGFFAARLRKKRAI